MKMQIEIVKHADGKDASVYVRKTFRRKSKVFFLAMASVAAATSLANEAGEFFCAPVATFDWYQHFPDGTPK